MHLRSAVLASAAFAFAVAPMPAMARDEPAATGRAAEITAKLNDPMTQYAIAGMLSAMSKALLDMPVAPMVDAVEKASGRRPGNLPRDARVADLAGTDQDKLREQIVEHVPRAMAALGALATAAEAMTPELERMARTMRESMPK
jgi:hypothetical protein